MDAVRRKDGKDLGVDTEGLELEQVFKGTISIHPPAKARPAPKAPEPPPRMPVEQRDEETYVLKGVFDNG